MKKGFVAGNFDVIHPGYIKMFLHEKQPIGGGIRYKFRTRVEYSSETPTRINDWRVADCLKSTIDDYLVPALSRSKA